MKKRSIFSRIMRKLIFIVTISCLMFFLIPYIKGLIVHKSNETAAIVELNTQTENKIYQEQLKQKIIQANMYITKINLDTEILVLKVYGNYSINTDRTPENNKYTEWLNNSEIHLSTDYTAIFSILTTKIEMKLQDDASVLVKFSSDNIHLSAIDLSNITAKEHYSVFGEKYKPNEVSALTNVAKSEITTLVNTKENIDTAFLNLKDKLIEAGTPFGVSLIF